jgi:hypothetical protein
LPAANLTAGTAIGTMRWAASTVSAQAAAKKPKQPIVIPVGRA